MFSLSGEQTSRTGKYPYQPGRSLRRAHQPLSDSSRPSDDFFRKAPVADTGRQNERQLPGRLVTWFNEHFAPGYTIFYNGAKCGASAPDHFHFQAAQQKDIPFIRQWDRLMERACLTGYEVQADNTLCKGYRIDNFICPIQAFITEGKQKRASAC